MEYTLKGVRYRIALPSLPLVATRICELSRDVNVGCKDLGELIAKDPSLAASVLRMANSPLYCRRGRVASIEEAATMMGSKAIVNLVIQVSLLGVCRDLGQDVEAEMGRYWRHSMAAALFADALVRASDLAERPSPEDAYTCALLHDLGELVLMDNLRTNYVRLLAFARTRGVPQQALERQLLSVDHAEVGARAMAEWNLPESLQVITLGHHAPGAMESGAGLGAFLAAADRLAEGLGGARSLNREACSDAVPAALEERLGLRPSWADDTIAASGRLQALSLSPAA